jgi:multimeric flavodoxin WrbA
MNLLAIVGSPRKGKATDTLVDKAIEGAKSKSPNCKVKKLHLLDHDIQFCKNCLLAGTVKRKIP